MRFSTVLRSNEVKVTTLKRSTSVVLTTARSVLFARAHFQVLARRQKIFIHKALFHGLYGAIFSAITMNLVKEAAIIKSIK